MWLAAPKVLVSRVDGYFDIELARVFVVFCDRWIASTQMMRAKLIRGRVLCGFHDWSQATGYDTESRKLFTRWVEEHGYRFQRITIYTPSRLVRMGIATAKLVL